MDADALFLGNTIHEGVERYTAILGEPTFLNFVVYESVLVISLVGLAGSIRSYPNASRDSPGLAPASSPSPRDG